MSSKPKPFISARIPEDLSEQLEARAEATGESKSSIVIEALSEYLNPSSASTSSDIVLEKRMKYFEQWILSLISNLESRVTSLEDLRSELHQVAASLGTENSSSALSTRTQRPKRLMPGRGDLLV